MPNPSSSVAVDGSTINQPLLAKVLGAALDGADPGAWLRALLRHRPGLGEDEALPLLFTVVLARAGGDMVTRFGGQRSWEVSLQLHMRGLGDRELSMQWGRYLRAMVPSNLVSGAASSVTGGYGNAAIGFASSVTGGSQNLVPRALPWFWQCSE